MSCGNLRGLQQSAAACGPVCVTLRVACVLQSCRRRRRWEARAPSTWPAGSVRTRALARRSTRCGRNERAAAACGALRGRSCASERAAQRNADAPHARASTHARCWRTGGSACAAGDAGRRPVPPLSSVAAQTAVRSCVLRARAVHRVWHAAAQPAQLCCGPRRATPAATNAICHICARAELAAGGASLSRCRLSLFRPSSAPSPPTPS